MKPRLACVGHSVYFSNHFCEKSSAIFDVIWVDFDHYSSRHYDLLKHARPDVSIIFRPELHEQGYLEEVPGIKIGISTEPFPKIQGNRIRRSAETDRRLATFSRISRSSFHRLYHYDVASREFCETIGIHFDGYRLLPVNTDYFRPRAHQSQPAWDAVFVGKATPRREAILSRLKASTRSLLWVEHGVSGKELASVFRRAGCVINLHADELPALEPRVYLSSCCGVPCLSEQTGATSYPMMQFVVEQDLSELSWDQIDDASRVVGERTANLDRSELAAALYSASGTAFTLDVLREVLQWL